jgi:sugar phosphate isomerase/epimerase
MPKVPAADALNAIARIGYQAVELTVLPGYTTDLALLDRGARQHLGSFIASLGLELPAIAGHSNLLTDDPEEYARVRARLREAIDLCVDLATEAGPPALNTTTGGRPDRWEALRKRLVERAGDLVEYAAGRGVTVAIEPHVGAALDRPERVLWLLRTIDSPHLRLNLDFSHFEAVGLPMEQTVAALAPHSVHTHVKDVRGRAPDHEFLIPGEGGFDYPAFLRALQHAGYDGSVTVEVSVMVQRRPGYDPIAAHAQAYETLAAAFRRLAQPE